jgi:hypothetical protein
MKLNKVLHFKTSASEDLIIQQLEQLTGWQPNRYNWQQGRFRSLKISTDSEQQQVMTLTTSFVGQIPLVQARIQVKNDATETSRIVSIVASFRGGVFVFAAYFAIFFVAFWSSDYTFVVKLLFHLPICLVVFVAYLGIHRDREHLIADIVRIHEVRS